MHCFWVTSLLLATFEWSESFSIFKTTRVATIEQTCNNFHRDRLRQLSISAKRRDSKSDDDGENSGPGMEAAFRELESLKSLDGDDDSSSGGMPPPVKKEQDEAFAKAMESLNLKDFVEVTTPPATLEKEVKVYQEMVSDLEKTSENELYSDLLSDMGGSVTKIISKSIPSLASLIPNLNDGTSVQDTQKFMDKALEEALAEAKEKAGNIDKSAVLDNKEIMKEIEAIFDNANKKLLDGLEEIRSEQRELVRKSSQQSGQATSEKMERDQQRMAMAEENMKKMLEKVNKETKEVEKAVEELKQAQVDMESDSMGQLISLKRGGIVKQATLVGALLFTIRSVGDGLLLMGGDASHMMPLVIQGAIALACLAAFLFL